MAPEPGFNDHKDNNKLKWAMNPVQDKGIIRPNYTDLQVQPGRGGARGWAEEGCDTHRWKGLT